MEIKLKKYDSYKNSGVEWLGEIPEHWGTIRIKNLFKEINERSFDGSEDLLSVSQYTGVTNKSERLEEGGMLTNASTLEGYKKVSEGDLVSNIMLAWNGSLGFSPFNGITSPAYSIYRLKSNDFKGYFHYLLRTDLYKSEFKRNSSGVIESRLRLYTDDFFRIEAIRPPLEEQTAIAKFLDDKTAKIEQAIAQKEKQIELLKERRQILIHKAVTKGINPDVKFKYSGLECIWDISEGWEVKRLKYLGIIKYGLGQPPKEKENGLPLIRATNVERGKIVEKDLIYVDPDDIPWHRDPELKENDIIVVRSGAYTADSAIITKEYIGAIAGYDMVFTPTKINPIFISFGLLSKYILFDQLYLLRLRAAQPHLNAEELGNTLVLFPPMSEQEDISTYIHSILIKISTAISLKEQEIEKLKEYKMSLINSVVTGKVRVC